LSSTQKILEALKQRSLVPDQEDLVSAMIGQWGGVEVFVADFIKAYDKAKQTAPMVAAKMLSDMLRMMNLVSEQRKVNAVESMDQQDLEAIVMEMTRKQNLDSVADIIEMIEENNHKFKQQDCPHCKAVSEKIGRAFGCLRSKER
jgi:hypothetical protein